MIHLASPATPETIKQDLASASIDQIASAITRNWANPSAYAKPYLEAMFYLTDMNSVYYHDDAKSIILYFLSNAASYRGPVAKLVKAELKSRCGVK